MTKNYMHSSMFVGKLDKKKIFHLCFCINNNLTGWPFLDFQSNKKTKQEVEFPFFFSFFFLEKKYLFFPQSCFSGFHFYGNTHKTTNLHGFPKALFWLKKKKKKANWNNLYVCRSLVLGLPSLNKLSEDITLCYIKLFIFLSAVQSFLYLSAAQKSVLFQVKLAQNDIPWT